MSIMSMAPMISVSTLPATPSLKSQAPLVENDEDSRVLTEQEERDLESRVRSVRERLHNILNNNVPVQDIKWQQEVYPIVRAAFDFRSNRQYPYLNRLIFMQLIEDSKNGDFSETRRLQDRYQPSNFLIGFFTTKRTNYKEGDKRKFDWNLEFMTYKPIPLDSRLKAKFPSKAKAVRMKKCSDGFKNLRRVAIFPDNFVMPEAKKVSQSSLSYYAIDRFYKRFIDKTEPIIQNCVSGKVFADLLMIDRDTLEFAASSWLCTHECNHSIEDNLPRVPGTDRPIVEQQFAYKITGSSDITELAAFEEMRVDIMALKQLQDSNNLAEFQEDKRKIAWQFILAERLLRYPADYGPKDFDSVVSFVLMNQLEKKNIIRVTDNKIEFLTNEPSEIQEALSNLLEEMNELKAKIYNEAREAGFSKAALDLGKEQIRDFVRTRAQASGAFRGNAYINPPFYENANRLVNNKLESFVPAWLAVKWRV